MIRITSPAGNGWVPAGSARARRRPPRGATRVAGRLAVAALAALLAPVGATAQETSALVVNPPEFVLRSGTAAAATLMAAARAPAGAEREVSLDMDVTYVVRRIRNPADGPDAYDDVRLRGYADANASEAAPPETPLVAPTISIRPGQTVRVTLHNQLPQNSTCGMGGGGSVNTPHCFNGTNLHTHGLWVNPSGNGDNVLISIRPGVTFQYEYNIPPDHPAGTFWYHPHLHGSTALQVSSGMSGALIIRGDRLPEGDRNGDLDTLLLAPGGQPVPERVLVLQQIQYACRDADGKIRTDAKGAYVCEPGDIGTIESYDQFGPGSWPRSGRYTSVNGQVLGQFAPATAGTVERWRLIHAGVRDTINFQLRPMTSGARLAAVAGLSAAATEDWIESNCGEPLPYHVVAQDGLTMAKAQRRTEAVLQPGYRVDALVVFPKAGDYCVVDGAAPPAANVNAQPSGRRLLGIVTAEGDATVAEDADTYLRDWLIAAAERTMPEPVRDDVIAGLRGGLALTRFVPHEDVCECDLTGHQELTFNIDVSQPGAVFFEIDGKPYDPNRIDRVLPVGGVEEWNLQSNLASHPFHIHVNPFQVVRILDAQGRDVSLEGATDLTDGQSDAQYPGLKGVWKDTLWVKNDAGEKYTIVVRTRYERYIGDFVLHCHILDHEDQGMMQNVRIALPDGHGGVAHGHH